MAERFFLLNYSKLTFSQCTSVGGIIGGSILYLRRIFKRNWIVKYPIRLSDEDLESPVPADAVSPDLLRELQLVIRDLQNEGFGEPEYRVFEPGTPTESAAATMLHANQEQIAQVSGTKHMSGKTPQVWTSITSLDSRWLNVTDHGIHSLLRDNVESDTVGPVPYRADGLYRVHRSYLDQRRKTREVRKWSSIAEYWKASHEWQKRQIDRFLASGYMMEISPAEAEEMLEELRRKGQA